MEFFLPTSIGVLHVETTIYIFLTPKGCCSGCHGHSPCHNYCIQIIIGHSIRILFELCYKNNNYLAQTITFYYFFISNLILSEDLDTFLLLISRTISRAVLFEAPTGPRVLAISS